MLLEQYEPDEAIGLCQGLIDEYPDSAQPHATMGDILAAQGRWNDAVDRYEAALDLEFDPAVMERLATARGNAIREGTARPVAADISEPAFGQGPPAEKGASQYVVGAVIAGVLIVSVAAFYLINAVSQRDQDDSQLVTRAAQFDEDIYADTPAMPSGTVQAPTGAPSQPARTVGAPAAAATVSTASSARPREAGTKYTGQPPVSRSGTATRTGSGMSSTGIPISSRDETILTQLRLERRKPGQSTVRPASMALDDYSGLGILTISAPVTRDLNRLETDLLYAAFYSARTALRSETALNTLVIRCTSSIPDETGKLQNTVIFRTTVSREHMDTWLNTENLPTINQIQTDLLKDIWWNRAGLARYVKSQGRRER